MMADGECDQADPGSEIAGHTGVRLTSAIFAAAFENRQTSSGGLGHLVVLVISFTKARLDAVMAEEF